MLAKANQCDCRRTKKVSKSEMNYEKLRGA